MSICFRDAVETSTVLVGKTVGVSHGFGLTEALRAAGADHIINDTPSLLDVIE